jgi:hypothetical protein
MAQSANKKTIAFFHPDLGIGGAERLIVDAAVGLQNRGHKVVIFTSHCNPQHCFDEARDGIVYVIPEYLVHGLIDIQVRSMFAFGAIGLSQHPS